jgi:hypothetical protein
VTIDLSLAYDPSLEGVEMEVERPRHQVGQLVLVRDVIFSRYAGLTGTVLSVHPHARGNQTLDKYTVSFTDGRQGIFWDIQLEATGAFAEGARNPAI